MVNDYARDRVRFANLEGVFTTTILVSCTNDRITMHIMHISSITLGMTASRGVKWFAILPKLIDHMASIYVDL